MMMIRISETLSRRRIAGVQRHLFLHGGFQIQMSEKSSATQQLIPTMKTVDDRRGISLWRLILLYRHGGGVTGAVSGVAQHQVRQLYNAEQRDVGGDVEMKSVILPTNVADDDGAVERVSTKRSRDVEAADEMRPEAGLNEKVLEKRRGEETRTAATGQHC